MSSPLNKIYLHNIGVFFNYYYLWLKGKIFYMSEKQINGIDSETIYVANDLTTLKMANSGSPLSYSYAIPLLQIRE